MVDISLLLINFFLFQSFRDSFRPLLRNCSACGLFRISGCGFVRVCHKILTNFALSTLGSLASLAIEKFNIPCL